MLLRPPPTRRRAASLVEVALVYPVIILLTIGLIIVAMGVYDYLQVTALAREGARWALVHGGQYQQETGNPMATKATILSTAIVPKAIGLDTTKLDASVSWDNSSEIPIYDDASGNVAFNRVTVTVTYQWTPLMYLSPMTFSSTSVMMMQY
jgi:Flp pilus assembly protein TadG